MAVPCQKERKKFLSIHYQPIEKADPKIESAICIILVKEPDLGTSRDLNSLATKQDAAMYQPSSTLPHQLHLLQVLQ
ncbi:hypothetical protein HKD37_09G024670 [Glycine soja]